MTADLIASPNGGAGFTPDFSAEAPLTTRGIDAFVHELQADTHTNNPDFNKTVEHYTQLLEGGGKRTRAALTVWAYHAFGGDNPEIAAGAAAAVEAAHASLLGIDD